MLQRKNYAALGQITAPYVHAVSHNGTLYVSGLTVHGTSAGQHDIAAQAEAIFDQLEVITHAEQTSLQNLIKVTILLPRLLISIRFERCCSNAMGVIFRPAHWFRSAPSLHLNC